MTSPVTHSTAPHIGVLAVQGDVREHVTALEAAGARVSTIRRPQELAHIDGLVLPGGESTTMDKLTRAFDLRAPLMARIASGMPTYGSCAGLIMLADRVADAIEGQLTLGGLNITARRNAFGRQVASFETDLDCPAFGAEPVRAVFIRAPWVEDYGSNVDVLAMVTEGSANRAVAVRQGHVLATSFHPEVTGDIRVHQYFLDMVRDAI